MSRAPSSIWRSESSIVSHVSSLILVGEAVIQGGMLL